MNEPPEKKKSPITPWTASEAISAGIRTIAANFPVAAGLAQAWNEWEDHRFAGRVEEFFANLSSKFAHHGERIAILEGHLKNSPEFADLTERIVRKVAVETDARKRRIFATAFFNCITAGDQLSVEDRQNIVESLDSLTMSDIEILQKFSSGDPVKLAVFFPESTDTYAESGDQKEIAGKVILSIKKLESRALIIEMPELVKIQDHAPTWADKLQGMTYSVLPAGELLLEAIR